MPPSLAGAPSPLHPCIPASLGMWSRQRDGHLLPPRLSSKDVPSKDGCEVELETVLLARTEVVDTGRQQSCVASAVCRGADTGVEEEFPGLPCSEEEHK